MIGVAAASASKEAILIAGIAGLVAGALSMAAGEYVSVSSQRDAEQADIKRETRELASDPKGELEEPAAIYRRRGLDGDLARKVAEQLSAADRLTVHMRDELGLDDATMARPVQAAMVSAASFAGLGLLPVLTLVVAPASIRIIAIALVSLVSRPPRPPRCLGALGGRLGDAPIGRASLRVLLGGGTAMATTASSVTC